MNFKNNIATTREQSERLLAMGMKPETADMHYFSAPTLKHDIMKVTESRFLETGFRDDGSTPAWSLSRLLEMMPRSIEQTNRPNADLDINSDDTYWFITYEELGYEVKHQVMKRDLFDAVIDMIAWLIDNGCFNKDLLR